MQLTQGGTVRVLGEPAGSPALRRRLAYDTQAASVYPDLTVTQNLGYFARLVRAPRGDVVRVLEHVGLGDQARQLAGTLSGGQLKRLSLAVALLGNPELLVLDEPTVGLDPVLREELWTLFRGLTAAGMTLIVSSHVMDEALRCDDLVLLRAGQLVARTTPAGLAAQTGQSDPDAAFLELIRRAARDPQGVADDDAPAPRRHGRHAAGDEVAS